jgi:hypothetical protein
MLGFPNVDSLTVLVREMHQRGKMFESESLITKEANMRHDDSVRPRNHLAAGPADCRRRDGQVIVTLTGVTVVP